VDSCRRRIVSQRRFGGDQHRRLGRVSLGIRRDKGNRSGSPRHRNGERTARLDRHGLPVGGQRGCAVDETAYDRRALRRRSEDSGGHHQQRADGIERERPLDRRPPQAEPAGLGHDQCVAPLDDDLAQRLGTDHESVAILGQRNGVAVDLESDIVSTGPGTGDA
jgi:hypothetical protein